MPRVDRQLLVHVFIVFCVSAGFESLFVHHGLSAMDEGWPLHAAMELLDGKTLYDEVFWVFPPGHLLPAWIAYALDPPGVVLTRIFYAGFAVAAALASLFVGRRLMPADFALLGALLVAVAAPRSHFEHLLFGYRYLVWSLLVLLFFHLRLSRDDTRWLLPAGVLAGVAIFFRLTPGFAVSVAVGVGIAAASRDPRRWIQDGLWYSAGIVLVWIPILLWFHSTVGLERFWIEMVVRPVEMTALQSKPLPPILLANLNRTTLSFAFASIGFRLYWFFYAGLLGFLLLQWARAVRAKRPFDQTFLLVFVVFGAVYFTRSVGRSDVPHLDSAMPPIAVLLAYCVSRIRDSRLFRGSPSQARARASTALLCLAVFGTWVFLYGSERFLDTTEMMGDQPLRSLNGAVEVRARSIGGVVDRLIPVIREHAAPDQTILVLTAAPLFHVLADRRSPGYFDVVMPGTFRTPQEEIDFVERLRAAPPAVLIWPRQPFDRTPARGLARTAPRLHAWALEHYETLQDAPIYRLMVPKRVPVSPKAPASSADGA